MFNQITPVCAKHRKRGKANFRSVATLNRRAWPHGCMPKPGETDALDALSPREATL